MTTTIAIVVLTAGTGAVFSILAYCLVLIMKVRRQTNIRYENAMSALGVPIHIVWLNKHLPVIAVGGLMLVILISSFFTLAYVLNVEDTGTVVQAFIAGFAVTFAVLYVILPLTNQRRRLIENTIFSFTDIE